MTLTIPVSANALLSDLGRVRIWARINPYSKEVIFITEHLPTQEMYEFDQVEWAYDYALTLEPECGKTQRNIYG